MVSNPRLSLFHKSEIKKKKEERENVRYIVIYTNEEDAWNEEQVACKQYFFPSIFFFFKRETFKGKIGMHDSFDRNIFRNNLSTIK